MYALIKSLAHFSCCVCARDNLEYPGYLQSTPGRDVMLMNKFAATSTVSLAFPIQADLAQVFDYP
jgi:hypothetical protein